MRLRLLCEWVDILPVISLLSASSNGEKMCANYVGVQALVYLGKIAPMANTPILHPLLISKLSDFNRNGSVATRLSGNVQGMWHTCHTLGTQLC